MKLKIKEIKEAHYGGDDFNYGLIPTEINCTNGFRYKTLATSAKAIMGEMRVEYALNEFKYKYEDSLLSEFDIEEVTCESIDGKGTINTVYDFFLYYNGKVGVVIDNKETVMKQIKTIALKEFPVFFAGFTADKISNKDFETPAEDYRINFDNDEKPIIKEKPSINVDDFITPTTGPFKGLEFKVIEILEDGIKAVMVGEKDPVPMMVKNYEWI